MSRTKRHPDFPRGDQYFGDWLADELTLSEISPESFASTLSMPPGDLRQLLAGEKDFTPELVEQCIETVFPSRPDHWIERIKEVSLSRAEAKSSQGFLGNLDHIRKISPRNFWRLKMYLVNTKIAEKQWTDVEMLKLIKSFFEEVIEGDPLLEAEGGESLKNEMPLSLMSLWGEMLFLFVSFEHLPDALAAKWTNTLRDLAMEARALFVESVPLEIAYSRGELTGTTERHPTPLVASLKEQSTPDLQQLVADLSSEIERRTRATSGVHTGVQDE